MNTEVHTTQQSARSIFYLTIRLSAEASVHHCVKCATCGNARLERLSEDFYQVAFLTILEEGPKYNPDHDSGASFTTFIKSRVCGRLWSERRKEMKYLPCSQDEEDPAPEDLESNPLVEALIAGACACESFEDTVVQNIEVDRFRKLLPRMLSQLSKKEREVLRLKYFACCSGVEIADVLAVSEGRVSQITKSALVKLKKTYLRLLEEICPIRVNAALETNHNENM